MRALIDLFGNGCSVVVCKPFPLQFEGDKKHDKKEFTARQQKIRKHWAKVGFRRVPKTDLYILSPLLKPPELPSIK